MSQSHRLLFVMCAAVLLLTGCALPPPETLESPTPIQNNSGKYLNPFLADGNLAPWADKGIHANRFGAAAGAFAASSVIGIVDITGMAAAGANNLIKQQGAIDASGGKEVMKATSDSSFDVRKDYVVYLYVNHSTKELYKKTLELVQEIYPDVASNYENDIRNARKKPTAAPVANAR